MLRMQLRRPPGGRRPATLHPPRRPREAERMRRRPPTRAAPCRSPRAAPVRRNGRMQSTPRAAEPTSASEPHQPTWPKRFFCRGSTSRRGSYAQEKQRPGSPMFGQSGNLSEGDEGTRTATPAPPGSLASRPAIAEPRASAPRAGKCRRADKGRKDPRGAERDDRKRVKEAHQTRGSRSIRLIRASQVEGLWAT